MKTKTGTSSARDQGEQGGGCFQNRRVRRLSMLCLSLAFWVGGHSIGEAQKKPKQENAKPKKVKTFDFSADEIDGELVKPDGDFVDPRKFASHDNLIRIRLDFIREILKSAENL